VVHHHQGQGQWAGAEGHLFRREEASHIPVEMDLGGEGAGETFRTLICISLLILILRRIDL